MEALRSSTVLGAKWTLGATILTAALQILFGVVLARILGPAAFGLMALGNVVLTFSNYFVRMGMGPAIVQSKDLSDEDVNFAFTFSIVIGLAVSILLAVSSSLIASLFIKPELGPILRAAGISLFFTAVSSTLMALLQRQMEFKKVVMIETAGFVLGSGVVSVGMALLGYGVWSLVIGLIVNRFVQLVLALAALGRAVRLRFALAAHRRLVWFSSYYSMNSLLEYGSANLDTVTVGRLFSSEAVGLYTRAYYLANMPVQLLVSSLTRVMYPVFSRLQSNRAHMVRAQLELLSIVGALSMAICLGMIPAADKIVLVMLGSQWLGSVLVLRLLLIAVPFDFMAHVFALTFDAAGELKRKTRLQLATLVLLVLGLALLGKFGLWGIGLAITLSSAIHLGLYVVQNKRVLSVPVSDSLRVILGSILVGAVVFFGIGVVSLTLGAAGLAPILVLLAEILTGGLAALLFFAAKIPDLLGFDETAKLGSRVRGQFQNWLGWRNARGWIE